MVLASAGGGVTAVLFDILIVLVAAKVAAEIAERIGVPAVAAEIVAGILVGPSVLDLVGGNEVLAVLGEIGVILLLLEVGMEMDLRDLRAVGRASTSVAAVGVAAPMTLGYVAMTVLGEPSNTALFLGAALAATSVGVTARVFSDLRALSTVEARTVLGAAVVDDVLGLVILTVVVRLVGGGSVSVLSVAGIIAVAIGFLVLTTALGSRYAPALFRGVNRYARSPGTLVAVALAFTLLFAEFANAAKLAPIVGAFVAGLALSRSEQRERIQRELAPVGHLFIPVFFLGIGIQVDVASFAKGPVLGIAAVLLVVGVIGKLVSALGAAGARGDKWLMGIGMIPRGEVGLIFATIGLTAGVLTRDLYAALLLVVLVTTVLAPPLLKVRLRAIVRRRGEESEVGELMPVGGWLLVDDGTVDLAARPPAAAAIRVAFDAAAALESARAPGPRLLDWLGELGDARSTWDAEATGRLLDVLEFGSDRSWRFLERTGVLERALPELAAALRARRADPYLLDAGQTLRFELVEELRRLPADDPQAGVVWARLDRRGLLLLAARVLDATGDGVDSAPMAAGLVARLGLEPADQHLVVTLVEERDLLRALAARTDGLSEDAILPAASHLETAEAVRGLYLLSLAVAGLDAVERGRLDEMLGLLLAVVDEAARAGTETRTLVDLRRAEAAARAGGRRRIVERIEHAPRGYLLSQDATAIERQARLIEPLPGRGQARVAVEAEGTGRWRIEVASRDRAGLLARVSGVLADHGLDVLEATVATWGDGAAIESFLVTRPPLEPPRLDPEAIDAAAPPDAVALEASIVRAFDDPLVSPPNPDAEVAFDDAASPWYTLCEVRSPDRRGLLHMITVGLASAGASVHSARLVTQDGQAVDRFELTDRDGRKLTRETKDAVRAALVGGVMPTRGRRARRRATAVLATMG
ncbi:MAG: cation:proton antiporter [Actinomycetes bacterium]